MSGEGRIAILGAISRALRRGTPADGQASHGDETGALQPVAGTQRTNDAGPEDREALAASFGAQLALLGGAATIVEDVQACAGAIARHMTGRQLRTLALQSSTLALAVGQRIAGVNPTIAQQTPLPELEACASSLVEALALFADTGSALLIVSNRGDRALPYLARTCFIVATMERLHSSLDNAALSALHQAARSKEPGEAVIVTGPSRTADIEKILILGAHGPEDVRIYIMRNSSP